MSTRCKHDRKGFQPHWLKPLEKQERIQLFKFQGWLLRSLKTCEPAYRTKIENFLLVVRNEIQRRDQDKTRRQREKAEGKAMEALRRRVEAFEQECRSSQG
jgi:hypothetical protein